MLFTRRKRHTQPSLATATPTSTPYPCQDLDALPLAFSPVIGELMAVVCHTRAIGDLSQNGQCADEYQFVARSVIQHILEGWQNQTGGHGTIEDLLISSSLRTPPGRSSVLTDQG